jgi:hypothetical protein
MKTLAPRRFQALIVLSLAALFVSCAPPAPGIYKNDKIKSSKQSDFHELNTEAFGYLKKNSFKEIKLMFSRDLLTDAAMEHEVEVIGNDLTDYDYQLMDEYYIVSKDTAGGTVPIAGDDINRYGLKYPSAPSRERYFAFFLPKKSDNKSLITLAYTKYNYGWRISAMDVEPYTIDGKTGPELYEQGKEEYQKKYLIAAVNTMALAAAAYSPSSVWVYPKADSMATLNEKVGNEANDKYSYPLSLGGVPTAPQLLSISNVRNEKGTFPGIYYRTHYNISDTTDIKKENLLVQKYLSKIMPGIDRDVKYIYYSAYNKLPSTYESIDHFDMTEVVKH